jgi:hypothetical protein
MKRLIVLLLVLSSLVVAQPDTGTKTGAQLRQQWTVTGIVSGGTTGSFANDIGATSKVTFSEIILGAPATVSIVISGCMRGSGAVAAICDVLETNVTNANANRHPAITVLYDFFTVVPTFTGGTTPTLTVNYTAAN